ncbi:MAG TPA: sigma-70 family RNA polymerase sigma factor [Fluviicola sp.]|nr:sigma-70 family RNA polymerase sigma factor [Fluviicola sp.]
MSKAHTKAIPNDNDFLTEVYNRYGKKLYAYALKTWKISEDDAWNLIYKTLYKVIETHQNYTFESEDKFASFVFRIFINYLRNDYRDKKKTTIDVAPTDVSEIQVRAEEHPPREEPDRQIKVLREVLDGLEDWQRILVLMRSDGAAYSEIAKYVDKPEQQLKVYYQRIKEVITKKLNDHA